MARIVVIGGGIVGLACAHELAADGHAVSVLDRDPDGDKCSWGNAGGIGVSEVIPAASLTVLARVPRYLLDPLGPLAIRPAHLPALLPWLAGFVASARPASVARGAAALAALTARAHDDLVPLLTAIGLSDALVRAGALTVYRSRARFEGEAAEWALRGRLGVAWQALSGAEVRAMEPALGPAVACGVLVPGWSHVRDPRAVWAALLAALRARGVAVRRAEVADLDADARVRTADGAQHAFDAVVVAAGAWSARLARRLGDRVLLASERGYNTTNAEPGVTLAREIIFAAEKFVAAPLAPGLRIGGAAEFAALDAPPNFVRARRLRSLAKRYLPGLSDALGTEWMGQRPATPDSLPVIGLSPAAPRIAYAFGHGHLGLTLAATTARLIADRLAGRPALLDLAPYSIARFAAAPARSR